MTLTTNGYKLEKTTEDFNHNTIISSQVSVANLCEHHFQEWVNSGLKEGVA